MQLLAQVEIFMAQAPRIDGILDQDEHLLQRQRFFREIVGAQLGRAHRRFDRPMPRDHDDLWRIIHLANLPEHLQPINPCKPDIQQNQVEARLAQQVEAVFATRADAGLVAFVLENASQRLADAGFVVNDEDVCHDFGRSSLVIRRWRNARYSSRSIESRDRPTTNDYRLTF